MAKTVATVQAELGAKLVKSVASPSKQLRSQTVRYSSRNPDRTHVDFPVKSEAQFSRIFKDFFFSVSIMMIVLYRYVQCKTQTGGFQLLKKF